MSSDVASAASRRPFIGRENELGFLRRARESALQDVRRVLLIAGEAGVGKSRLLAEAAADARSAGWQVLLGHAYNSEGMPPYLPIIESLRDYVRDCPEPQLRQQIGSAGAEVALLVPEVRLRLPDLPAGAPLDTAGDRYRLFEAVSDFLMAIAAGAPSGLLLCLDDLHWADDSTLLLVEHMARRPASAPLLIVATYRDTDVDSSRPLSRTLEQLARQRASQRLDLARLAISDVAALLAALGRPNPPRSLVEILYRETEGNPFFIEEVFDHLNDEGRLFEGDGSWRATIHVAETEVPQSVLLVIGRRLDRLSDTCRRVLAVASVLGRVFDFDTLLRLGDASEDALLEALEEAEQARLLTSDAQGRVTFAHELIRQTLLRGLSKLRLQRLHLRAAEAIESAHAGNIEPHLSELAGHLRSAGAATGDEKAYDYTIRAAAAAEDAFAWEEAVRCYDWCLGVLRAGNAPSVDEASLLAALGRARTFAGQHELAADVLTQAAALFRERGDWEGSARATLLALRGPTPVFHGGDLINLALEAPGPRNARLEALLLLHRADLSARDPGEAEADAVLAESLVDAAEFPDVEAALSLHRGLVFELNGQVSEAEPFFRAATAGFMALGDFEQAGRAKLRIAHCFIPAGPIEAAAEALSELAAHGERYGQSFAVEGGYPLWANMLIRLGDLDGARDRLQHLPDTSRHTNFWRVWLAELRGDFARATLLVDSLDASAPIPLLQMTALGSRCRLLYNSGQIEQARRLFPGWAEIARQTASDDVVHFWNAICIEAALVEFADGELLRHFYDLYSRYDHHRTYVLGSLDEFRGNLALKLGLTEDAERWYRLGLEWTQQERCVLDEALCIQGLGDLALHGGRRAEARRLFAQAAEAFETYGAGLYLGRARARLSVLGGASAHPDAQAYPDGLSEREVDVLRLLAQGKGNQQIADELVISLNTVRRHVSNILDKTGLSNRTEAGVYAHRNNLV